MIKEYNKLIKLYNESKNPDLENVLRLCQLSIYHDNRFGTNNKRMAMNYMKNPYNNQHIILKNINKLRESIEQNRECDKILLEYVMKSYDKNKNKLTNKGRRIVLEIFEEYLNSLKGERWDKYSFVKNYCLTNSQRESLVYLDDVLNEDDGGGGLGLPNPPLNKFKKKMLEAPLKKGGLD